MEASSRELGILSSPGSIVPFSQDWTHRTAPEFSTFSTTKTSFKNSEPAAFSVSLPSIPITTSSFW